MEINVIITRIDENKFNVRIENFNTGIITSNNEPMTISKIMQIIRSEFLSDL